MCMLLCLLADAFDHVRVCVIIAVAFRLRVVVCTCVEYACVCVHACIIQLRVSER